MASKVKSSLNSINKVSREILSLLESQKKDNKARESQQISTLDTVITDEKIASLVEKRQSKITKFFEMYTQEQISAELQLINEMMLINQQLTTTAHFSRQELAEQMVKLRNHEKVAKLYQKY